MLGQPGRNTLMPDDVRAQLHHVGSNPVDHRRLSQSTRPSKEPDGSEANKDLVDYVGAQESHERPNVQTASGGSRILAKPV